MTGFKSRFGFVILSLGMLVTIYWDKLGLRQRFQEYQSQEYLSRTRTGIGYNTLRQHVTFQFTSSLYVYFSFHLLFFIFLPTRFIFPPSFKSLPNPCFEMRKKTSLAQISHLALTLLPALCSVLALNAAFRLSVSLSLSARVSLPLSPALSLYPIHFSTLCSTW